MDDYAHHPAEISATLSALKNNWPEYKITVIFQPHTFSRTKALFNDFVKSFAQVDELIILDIYGSAREKPGGAHSRDLAEKIRIRNQESGIRQTVKYISTLAECERYLRDRVERNDVVVLMGAGDIFRVGENLVKG